MSTSEVSNQRSVGAILNRLGLLGISLILAVAFFYQLALGELPCPLCLLQRAGFIAIGMGFLFNLRLGERGSHYAMILVSSLVTGFISIRQVSLHLAPGDPGYGSALFGLHFYTWALIAAVGIVCYVALIEGCGRQARRRRADRWAGIECGIRDLRIAGCRKSAVQPCWSVARGSATTIRFAIFCSTEEAIAPGIRRCDGRGLDLTQPRAPARTPARGPSSLL